MKLDKIWIYAAVLAPIVVGSSSYLAPDKYSVPVSEIPPIHAAAPEPVRRADIIFVGDMLFDRHIRNVISAKGGDFVFSCIGEFLRSADLVVGNLEGPITSSPSVSLGSKVGSPENFLFTFPEWTAGLLAEHNIKIANLGNNHIGNFGPDGIRSTREFLSAAGVGFFGGLAGDEPVRRAEVNGVSLSFVSYNEFGGSKPDKVAETVRQEKSSGRTVILYAHWGDEYSTDIKRIQGPARSFAGSGADLIVGSHPHIVLPREQIGDTQVYYSLGNFIFDQYFSEDVSRGLALLADISAEGISVQEFGVKLERDGRTCPAETALPQG